LHRANHQTGISFSASGGGNFPDHNIAIGEAEIMSDEARWMGPFIILFEQDRAKEANDRVLRKMPTSS
jgi:hypothetical protein